MFFVPAFVAYTYGVIIFALIYFIIPFTSGSFHACEEGFGCLFPFVVHINLDYITATLIVPMTCVYFVHWKYLWAPMQDILVLLYLLVIGLMVVNATEETVFTWQAFIFLSAISIVVVYWIGYFLYAVYIAVRPTRYFPRYEWRFLFFGVSFTAIGLSLFITQGRFAYIYVGNLHGMWHILAAAGQALIIKAKAPQPISFYYWSKDDHIFENNSVKRQIQDKYEDIMDVEYVTLHLL